MNVTDLGEYNPLVDIMLVLLIIFLITIPVVIKSVPITLPVASNIVTITKPENITIAIDKSGNYYWNDAPVTNDALFDMLKEIAVKAPHPRRKKSTCITSCCGCTIWR